ncbi:MAG: hypothetical protein R2694_20845 [Ilumatobacteraceae bacterium]
MKATLVVDQYRRGLLGNGVQDHAGQMAFKKAAEMAKPVILEPIMQVEVVTPENT